MCTYMFICLFESGFNIQDMINNFRSCMHVRYMLVSETWYSRVFYSAQRFMYYYFLRLAILGLGLKRVVLKFTYNLKFESISLEQKNISSLYIY